MINRNELEEQIDTVVNANNDYYTDDQVSQIADEILDLDGFDLEKGDDVDSIDSDVFWELVEDIDDRTDPKAYTEDQWRAQEQ
jgi:hypothetical protein